MSDRGRLVFVGGVARSGTTLVQNMLDSHPNVLGAAEFHFMDPIVRLRNRMLEAVQTGAMPPISDGAALNRCFEGFISEMFLPAADSAGCILYSEKTPDNVLLFEDILAMIPSARCIWVVRDPRAVVASLLEVGRRAVRGRAHAPIFTRSLWAAVRYVTTRMQRGVRAYRKHPGRVLVLRYEEMVTDPLAASHVMCEFLGLEWTETMLHPALKRHLGEVATRNGFWYTPESFYRDPDPGNVSKWKSVLTAFQEAIVCSVFARKDCLGYTMKPEIAGKWSLVLARAWIRLLQVLSRCGVGALRWLKTRRWSGRIEILSWLLDVDGVYWRIPEWDSPPEAMSMATHGWPEF